MVGPRTTSKDVSEGALLLESGKDCNGPECTNGKCSIMSTGEMDANESGRESVEGIRNRKMFEQDTVLPHASEGSSNGPITSEESFLKVLLEGEREPLDTEVSMNSRPPWLDEELLRKGREFASKYLFGVISAHIYSLAMTFSFQSGLEPIIFSGKSDTPYKAFRRYLSTITRMVSWYETDCFEKNSEGYKNMASTRIMHASIFKKMKEASKEELRSKTTVVGRGTPVWCTYLEVLKKDFDEMEVDEPSCPFANLPSLSKGDGEFVYVNQLDLALTQLGFVALNILYPEQFGVHGATDENLEAYCHLWRCLGYLLGIKDRYNVCSEKGLEATRSRCRAVIDNWVKPGFRDLTPDWEHMYRCVLEGLNHYTPGNSFGGQMSYLMWVLGIPASNLRSKMTWTETALFFIQWFFLGFLMRIPGALQINNYFLRLNLKSAGNLSPEWLQRKKDIIYDYERVPLTKI